MTFGEYLKELRQAKGLSQKELSGLTNGQVSNAEISRLEAGIRKKPSPAVLKILAPHFGVPVGILLTRAGYMDDLQDGATPESWGAETNALETRVSDSQLLGQVQQLEEENRSLKEKNESLKEENRRIREETIAFLEEGAEMQAETDNYKKKMNQAEDTARKAKLAQEALTEEKDKLAKEVGLLQEQLKTATDTSGKQEIEELSQKLAEKEKALKEAGDKLRDVEAREAEWTEEKARLEKELAAVQETVKLSAPAMASLGSIHLDGKDLGAIFNETAQTAGTEDLDLLARLMQAMVKDAIKPSDKRMLMDILKRFVK